VEVRRTAAERRAAGLVVGAALLAYANGLTGSFVYDDRRIIEENPRVHGLSRAAELLTTPYWGTLRKDGLWRPLTLFTYAANAALTGLDPFFFHLVNVLLHAAVSLAVLFLGRRVLPPAAAAAGAVLFAVHPVHTEAVTGIVGRAELLAALFVLLALLLHARARPGPAALLGIAALQLAGLLSKENALALPLVALTLDLALGRRPRLAPLLAMAAAAALYLGARALVLGGHLRPPEAPLIPLAQLPAADRVLTALKLQGLYLWLLAFPRDLVIDRSEPQIAPVHGLSSAGGLLVLAGVALAAVALVVAARRSRPLLAALLFHGAALALVSNVFFAIGTNFGERLLYLPSVAFSLALGGLLARLPRPAFLAAAALLAVAGTARAWARNAEFRDDLALLESAARVSPRSARVRINYAHALIAAGRPGEAAAQLEEALRLETGFAQAWFLLGKLRLDAGNAPEGERLFREGLRRSPEDAVAQDLLALAVYRQRRLGDAEVELEKALALDPTLVDATLRLAALRRARQDAAGARAAIDRTLEALRSRGAAPDDPRVLRLKAFP
jgi:tetratricopeptide (TPR) repeat protein